MSKLGDAFVDIRANLKPLVAGLKKARRATVNSMRAISSVALKGLTFGFKKAWAAAKKLFNGIKRLAQIAAAAIIGVTIATAKMAGGFERSMARVRALSNATEADFRRLRYTALRLGEATEWSAKQAADAMSALALAGFKTNEIIAAMPHTLNLASAGQIDLASAADITAKIMRGMGLDASELGHAVDVLTKAFTTSNTDLIQLGEAMKYVGPVGRAAGKSLEELVAVIQVLSNAGIQGAMAGTSLRGMIAKLSGATPAATKVFDKLGIIIKNSSGRMKTFDVIVNELADSMKRLDEVEKTSRIMRAFGLRAGPAMSVLLSEGGDAVEDFRNKLVDIGGTARRISAIMLNTLWGDLVRLKSVMAGLSIAIGDTYKGKLRTVIQSLTKWLQENKKEIVDWAKTFYDKLGEILGQIGKLVLFMTKDFNAGMRLAFDKLIIVATAAFKSLVVLAKGPALEIGKIFADAIGDAFKKKFPILSGITGGIGKLSPAGYENPVQRFVRSREPVPPSPPSTAVQLKAIWKEANNQLLEESAKQTELLEQLVNKPTGAVN